MPRGRHGDLPHDLSRGRRSHSRRIAVAAVCAVGDGDAAATAVDAVPPPRRGMRLRFRPGRPGRLPVATGSHKAAERSAAALAHRRHACGPTWRCPDTAGTTRSGALCAALPRCPQTRLRAVRPHAASTSTASSCGGAHAAASTNDASPRGCGCASYACRTAAHRGAPCHAVAAATAAEAAGGPSATSSNGHDGALRVGGRHAAAGRRWRHLRPGKRHASSRCVGRHDILGPGARLRQSR